MVSVQPASKSAYKLMQQGVLALSRIEASGMKIDVPYLEKAIKKTTKKIKKIEEELKQDKVYKAWKRRFGDKTKLGSHKQLGVILYEELGIKAHKFTAAGSDGSEARYSTDKDALAGIDIPFVKAYARMAKLQKVKSTYLEGIRREVVDGFLHPVFNLHLVKTYRSSSDTPNFQNIPVRDPEQGKIIRQCFIPRSKDRCIAEIDFSGVEVRVAACYNLDPVLISYIKDTSKDMHRDMAAQCYKIDPGQVSKMARYCAKNMFVFPEFYGSFYAQCAPNLWEAMDVHNLEVDGIPMRQHLKQEGIKSLGSCEFQDKPRAGTFEKHIMEVENDFWNNRFKVYAAWKKKWYEQYQKRGWVKMKTGFVVAGLYARNDIINYPVQGAAFHCLLQCLIVLEKWLRENKMRSVIIGQIHDSMVLDLHKDEVREVLAKARHIMTVEIMKIYPWLIVPLDVEAEVAPLGRSWFEKKEVKLAI